MAVILSMDSRKRLSVIPESGRGKRVMNLLNPNSLRVHFLESEAKNRALRIFMNIRDSSSPAAPHGKNHVAPIPLRKAADATAWVRDTR
jgi:hypothetical protein